MSFGVEIYDELGNINYELSEGTCLYDSTQTVPVILGGNSHTIPITGYDPATWFFLMFSGIPYYAVTIYPQLNEIEIVVSTAVSSLASFDMHIYRTVG